MAERKHGLTGRPGNALKGDKARSGMISVRVYEDVEVAAKEAAQRQGVSLPDYISGLILRDKS